MKYRFSQSCEIAFLRIFGRVGHLNPYMMTDACYFIELTLTSIHLRQVCPSLLAAASIFLSRRGNKRVAWTCALSRFTGYSASQVRRAARCILHHTLLDDHSRLKAADKIYTFTAYRRENRVPLSMENIARDFCAEDDRIASLRSFPKQMYWA